MNHWSQHLVGGLFESRNVCLVRIQGMNDQAGGAARAVRIFGTAGINIEFISESVDAGGYANITAAISMSDEDRLEELLPAIQRETTSLKVSREPNCSVLGIYGPDLRGIPGVATRLFAAFGEANINLLAISSSLSSLCLVVSEKEHRNAVSVISSVFDFALPTSNVAL